MNSTQQIDIQKHGEPEKTPIDGKLDIEELFESPNKLVKGKVAAEVLCVDEQTLSNWRSQKRGPTWVRIGKRGVRYQICDLQDFINQRKIDPEKNNSKW